jgi:hypothetical protein
MKIKKKRREIKKDVVIEKIKENMNVRKTRP